MGVAHHTHVFVWFELGRTELMREAGCTYGQLEDREGVFFPVTEAAATYHAPSRYDEVVTITTRLDSVSGVRVRFSYQVSGPDGEVRATGHTVHAAVDRQGRPRRLPQSLRARLAAHTEEPHR